jgi:glycosyltransferase involved in cell wall biosynthesis
MTPMPEKSEAVAVIIPVRDGAAFLAAAIGSVITQIGDHAAEIVVVDDGSRDESAAIAASDARVQCIRQLPLGIAAALNRGLEATTAPLIAFLDSDDLMPPDSLASRRAGVADDCNCEVVVGRMVQFVDPGIPPEMRQRLRGNSQPVVAHLAGTCLARRAVFDKVGRFDPEIGAPTFLDWVLRARHADVRFCEIDAVVLKRRIHGANLSLDRTQINAGYLMTLRRHLARLRAK